MSEPVGFTYRERKSGEVVIFHHGRRAAVLRGKKAEAFIAKVMDGEGQELMARVTGNYKRGNERRPSTDAS